MEFVHLNSPKTDHLDPLFHTFTDLINSPHEIYIAVFGVHFPGTMQAVKSHSLPAMIAHSAVKSSTRSLFTILFCS